MASFNVDDVDSEFYRAYGRALASWARLERSLGTILVRVAGLTPEVAGAIYYSAKSFQGRADMVRACVPFAKTIPAGRQFLTGVINRACAYSPVRNALAHNPHIMRLSHEPRRIDIEILDLSGKENLSLEGIVNAAQNFTYLDHVLTLCLGQKKLVREPELALALLGLMPDDPVATAVDLSAANALAKEIGQFPH